MSLHLHRAAGTDMLADALAAMLLEPSPDPFTTELVVVPAAGVERWLSQRLSLRLGTGPHGADGVCAGVLFRPAGSVRADLLGIEKDDPWRPDALAWRVLEVIDAHLGEAWCHYLNTHLGHGADDHDVRRGRRYSVARRLAGLFASYATHRPSLLADWESGHDTDGAAAPLAPDLTWQAELWRRVRARIPGPSPVERLAATAERLRLDPAGVALPHRVSWFGPTRIPAADVRLIAALAHHRDVHVWLPHPSADLWRSLTDVRPAPSRRDDSTYALVNHPLLAALGRDVREVQQVLGPVADTDDVIAPAAEATTGLLGMLQADIIANRAPDASGREVSAADHSLQIHACHGPARQVAVLREVILGLLADDPTLEPRDIAVMCPDIEAYAPLITAAFGAGADDPAAHPGQRLQVRLADRALTRTNPVLSVLARLLDLADGRAGVTEMLDLLTTTPVRARFGFTDADVETITGWITDAGVRWALDAEHRHEYGLARYVQNTWRFGLDRLLVGVAVSADAGRWFDTTLPLDDVGSTSIDLAGRFVECIDRIADVVDRLTGTHALSHWHRTLIDAVEGLTDVAWGEEWQVGQARREIGRAMDGIADAHVRLADVRALLGDRLGGRPTRANFRTGTLTVSSLVPMRSVPHRVVCVVGLDDGVFPRPGVVDGDDVMARRPLIGERDARSEDRQLLLDAIMAARDHLVMTYSGVNETNGAVRPPSVPLGELLDVIARTAPDARRQVLREHPLQPFDAKQFSAPAPFSFDAAAFAGARRLQNERVTAPTLAQTRLPARTDDVDLADLLRFVRDPVGQFLRQRLQVALPDEGEDLCDAIPVELDGLQRWAVGTRLLTDIVEGVDPAVAVGREWRRGELPPGRLGWRIVQDIVAEVRPIAEQAVSFRAGHDHQAIDIDLDLGGGRRLSGTVTDVYGDRIVGVGFSGVGPKQILDAWVPLLALSAAVPDVAWTSGLVGRSSRGPGRVTFDTIHEAAELLRTLVALYDAGLREPLPLPVKTGYAWASHRDAPSRAKYRATQVWAYDTFAPEANEPAHVAVWGERAPIEVLLGPPRPEERYERERTRLGALAAQLWVPILERVR